MAHRADSARRGKVRARRPEVSRDDALGPDGMRTDVSHPRNDWGHDSEDAPTSEHLHELAEIERLLRADMLASDPRVHVGGSGARISWASSELNEHGRGSLTAAMCSEIALSSSWGLATVHDPLDSNEGVVSMLTVVYDPDTTEAGQ